MSRRQEIDLLNQRHFPPLTALPFKFDKNSLYCDANFIPQRRWYFLLEIHSLSFLLSLTLYGHDVRGNKATVSLALPIGTDYTELNEKCRVGYTVAILCAKQQPFLDGTVGVKLNAKTLSTMTVIPTTLVDFIHISRPMKYINTCSVCGKPAGHVCRKCGMPFCDPACLREVWVLRHKAQCPAAAVIHFNEWTCEDVANGTTLRDHGRDLIITKSVTWPLLDLKI
ncbi:hypothetical protein BDN72DRAFT_865221 [Pluteus cervinus]|uniref:Uncharacterized protein n=1 Tax=Pluteus cervinus TaxID=181527 RepID=A0ACD3A1U2_9AGAR|nr:hypothetical protein BDN72DRAFT_865221 [Pluteus cervinus]